VLVRLSAAAMSFNDVSVSLPAKVRGPEAEEEWQEVDWVTWSTGSMAVDSECFLLVFKPTGGGSVKAKPLGNLIRAAAVGAVVEETKTFIVTTSESMHKTYRLTFQSVSDAAQFAEIAKKAESAHEALAKMQDAGSGFDPHSLAARLQSDIHAKLAGRCPLVFGGASLYGPDPNGEASNEVLLGRGAMVILDPCETMNRVGSYELSFYSEDEAVDKPTRAFQISPEMVLHRQEADEEDVAYTLRGPTLPEHSIRFEEDRETAFAFARDFRVRAKLMDLSLKTVRGRAAAQDLRSEIRGLKQASLAAKTFRAIRLVLTLVLLAAATRAGQLYLQDSQRSPAEYAVILSHDVGNAVLLSTSASAAVGTKVCELAFGAVDAHRLRECSLETSVDTMRRCIVNVLSGY